jgi:hypothetical protein
VSGPGSRAETGAETVTRRHDVDRRSATARRHDLDWLRVGATLLLFPFHVLKTFDTRPL